MGRMKTKKPSRSLRYLERMRADGFLYMSRLIHKDDMAQVDAIVKPRLARAAANRRAKKAGK